jgi:hypothetical protein
MGIYNKQGKDKFHLHLLAIFHFVLASIYAFVGCIPLIHVTMGIAMISGAFDQGPNPPPPEMGWFFAGVGGTMSVFFWVLAIPTALAGRCLARHTHYGFCYAVACIECIQVPKGTILGIFTIFVLSRPSVKALFDGVEYRDPRLDEVDDLDDDYEPPPRPHSDGAIQPGR